MSGPGRRRRWWRWTLAGVLLLAVIIVGGAAIFVKSQPSAVPLTMPSGAARPPTGPADGTSAVSRIDLTAITVGGKTSPQFAASLGTAAHPDATITLAGPVRLPAGFDGGRTVTAEFPGQLTLRGVTRPVTITVSARRDGDTVEVAGSLPVTAARWGITLPAGFGFLGGLSSQATAEFLLILHRSG